MLLAIWRTALQPIQPKRSSLTSARRRDREAVAVASSDNKFVFDNNKKSIEHIVQTVGTSVMTLGGGVPSGKPLSSSGVIVT